MDMIMPGRASLKKSITVFLPAVLVFFYIFFYIFVPSSSAKVYQWKDAAGNIVFGDSPPPGADIIDKKIRVNKMDVPDAGRNSSQKKGRTMKSGLRDASDIDVTLYEADWCPHCRNARAFLISKGVRLTEYDVDNDPGKAKEAQMKSGINGIPVIDVEGTIIVGDDLDAISQAIEQKRRENR